MLGGAMKKSDMQVYRERLLALRVRLRGDVEQMADATLKKSRNYTSGGLARILYTE